MLKSFSRPNSSPVGFEIALPRSVVADDRERPLSLAVFSHVLCGSLW